MAKKDKDIKEKDRRAPEQAAPEVVESIETTPETETPETPGQDAAALAGFKAALGEQEDKYLRLAAEYDNFRKRTQKEKEGIYHDAKADAVTAFLPVYDNLERALKQETSDEAYAKGVNMIMTQLKEVLGKLGVEEIAALGETFDPNLHNAVMHVEDESLGESTISEVFQSGFLLGEKVIRFAVVKVAN